MRLAMLWRCCVGAKEEDDSRERQKSPKSTTSGATKKDVGSNDAVISRDRATEESASVMMTAKSEVKAELDPPIIPAPGTECQVSLDEVERCFRKAYPQCRSLRLARMELQRIGVGQV